MYLALTPDAGGVKMASSEATVARQLLGASLTLPGASASDLLEGMVDLITALIKCDDVLWTEIDGNTSTAVVGRGRPLTTDTKFGKNLSRYGLEHPSVRSYLTAGDDQHPRRVSDVASQRDWRSSAVYTDVFRSEQAPYQLSLVVSLAGGVGRGWVLTRSSSDFSDRDLEAATMSLPVLVLLDHLRGAQLGAPKPPAPARESQIPTLTSREHQVLVLIAEGLTAGAIGRHLGITEETVRKHCQHLYNKMGCRDRLTAVLRAGRTGLLP
jgi:DNA-binding CsgD family transcriptional regulator